MPADTSREPLLNDVDVENDGDDDARVKDPEEHHAAVSLPQLFTAAELRKPLIIVCFSMLCQQLSGVNAGTNTRHMDFRIHAKLLASAVLQQQYPC